MTDRIAANASAAEARVLGRHLRDLVGRRRHADFELRDRDPVGILEEQHVTRLQGLIPVRIGRMLQSPFAYYRGTAAVMAHDLATAPVTGHHVVICGDAHISNFGLFASPERRVLFDLNDFDEASVGPWEWDVKRMAASVYIGARDNNYTEEQAASATEAAVRRYRETMATLEQRSAIERYFFQVETDWLETTVSSDEQKILRKTVRKARQRTSDQVLEKITTTDGDAGLRIKDQPPVMMHVDHASDAEIEALYAQYRSTLRADTALLLSQFTPTDYVLRVVGVGSVGTRCYVLLLTGPAGEPLFLQAKEAPASVIETYGGISEQLPAVVPPVDTGHQGYRVVSAQRILQAQSDPFLGWIGGFAGETAERRGVDYYWRQFRDMKGSVDLQGLTSSQFQTYAALCGAVLARAHSQSPGTAVISGYLGASTRFDVAVTEWSKAYADQIEQDFAAVEKAARQGRLPMQPGV
ncbi:DUF2252 domain-containing protein [Phytoactinopolyspora limicola]|uniref:DUF2252 domain-containing protein n=1 Tax=Phytoactinopolyspora limicola TaxID=2715536 RepID=UPI0014083D1F|nr:DUF2252 domain-containing protein [Phytoactinopolyspora limicola]